MMPEPGRAVPPPKPPPRPSPTPLPVPAPSPVPRPPPPNAASDTLRDVMDLCYRTAQRPGDVLKMLRADVSDGAIMVKQQKTGRRVRIEIIGPLADVLERIEGRKREVVGTTLLQTKQGKRITANMLRGSFDRARTKAGVDFQLRDLRAKAATDLADLGHAQKLLGHASRSMTEHYAGRRRGDLVAPVVRVIESQCPATDPASSAVA